MTLLKGPYYSIGADGGVAVQADAHVHRSTRTGAAPAPHLTDTSYLGWEWPATVPDDEGMLVLGGEVIAIALPAELSETVVAVLDARRCPVPVLADPRVPEYQVLLAGEPFGISLPWPPGVHARCGEVALPPTPTPLGPVTWQRPPVGPDLRACREFDIFAAVQTVLRAEVTPEAER